MTFSHPTIAVHRPLSLPKAAGILHRLGLAAVAAHEALAGWQERRRQLRLLEGMSDAALKDIGLTRADVFRERAKP